MDGSPSDDWLSIGISPHDSSYQRCDQSLILGSSLWCFACNSQEMGTGAK
jgi:hypothetical protein